MLIETKEKVTVENWLGVFENVLTQKGKSPLTIKNYLVDLRAFSTWFQQANGQAFSPELLNSWDLRTYRTWCLEVKKYKPATWNRRYASMQVFVNCFRKAGLILHDPLEDIPTAVTEEQAPHWLTASEFGRLMRQVELDVNGANTPLRRWRAIRDAAAVSVMVFAGLREAELVALLCSDVKISERKGLVVVRMGKGQKYREIPLNTEARRALGQWLEVRPSGMGALFVDESGHSLTTGAIQARVDSIGAAAKIDDLSPHRLRHTAAKRMLDAGRPLTEIQKILGHAKLSTTAKYLLAGWEDLEEAVEAIGQGKMAGKGRA